MTESTHGMKVWRLDLPLDDKDGTEREASLWDLAGQEDYRLIHQLFLDEIRFAELCQRLEAGKSFIVCQKCDKKVPLIDHIEQRLGTDPVARKVRDMEERDQQERGTQALEQILIGHMMAVCGEANQIFRQVSMSEYGIDGEVEFKDKDGRPSGKKIYVRLKSDGESLKRGQAPFLRARAYLIDDEPHLSSWASETADVYLVIRDLEGTIRWMNVTRDLK